MGGCQNYGPFLGTLNIRCRIITGIQKGTIILTTTQVPIPFLNFLAQATLHHAAHRKGEGSFSRTPNYTPQSTVVLMTGSPKRVNLMAVSREQRNGSQLSPLYNNLPKV